MKYFWIFLTVAIYIGCSQNMASDGDYERLALQFADPPGEARPKALWTWLNGNVDLETLSQEMAEADAQGLGGFDIWDAGMLVDPDSVVPKGTPFMGEESVWAIAHALREAEKYPMEMGLTISSSWNAGGSWVREEHGVMGLFRSGITLNGPGQRKIEIPQPIMEQSLRRGGRSRMLQLGDDGHWNMLNGGCRISICTLYETLIVYFVMQKFI